MMMKIVGVFFIITRLCYYEAVLVFDWCQLYYIELHTKFCDRLLLLYLQTCIIYATVQTNESLSKIVDIFDQKRCPQAVFASEANNYPIFIK